MLAVVRAVVKFNFTRLRSHGRVVPYEFHDSIIPFVSVAPQGSADNSGGRGSVHGDCVEPTTDLGGVAGALIGAGLGRAELAVIILQRSTKTLHRIRQTVRACIL